MVFSEAEMPRPPPWSWWRFLWGLLLFISSFGSFCTFISILLIYIRYIPELPNLDEVFDYQPKLGTRVFSADNQLIAEFAVEKRILFTIDNLPQKLKLAFMAAEDKRFYQHHGIDYVGMFQAFVDKLRHPYEKLRGASTITQQVAKSLLATHESYESATERSFSRKVKEALLAYHLERRMTKSKILLLYLNQIYLGNKAYGVGAAADHYFHKQVKNLTLAEMALLAGLPQRPSDYSPLHRPKAALARRKYVLKNMLKNGDITESEYAKAVEEKLVIYPLKEAYLNSAPFFAEQVRRELIERYGEHMVLEEGLQVYTTINLQYQSIAEKTLMSGVEELDRRQGYRGPLLHLSEKQREKWLQESQVDKTAALPLDKHNMNEDTFMELALVTGFSNDGRMIYVQVDGEAGIIPLVAIEWARPPNPVEKYGLRPVRDARKILSVDDVVMVKKMSYQTLKNIVLQGKSEEEASPKIVSELKKLRQARLFTLYQKPLPQGSFMALDPHTAEVRAMIGGYNFEDSSYNRAIQACREPGSLFKPIVYATAIDKLGYTASTLIDDKPVVFDDFNNNTRWKPSNATSQFRGKLPLRTCLKDSINTAAIRVADTLGMEVILKNAHTWGIQTPLKDELGTALGSSCTTLWDLMQVYTTLHQYGRRRRLHIIRRVVDRFGNILEDNTHPSDPTLDTFGRLDAMYRFLMNPAPRVLNEQSGFLTVSLLKNVIKSGTATRALKLKQIAGGKTGTTNDAFDAWFIGFTRNILAGVWMGHDKNERPLGPGEQGGRTALPVWLNFMQAALLDYSHEQAEPKPTVEGDFPVPEGIVEVVIDPRTGLLARENGKHSVTEYYRMGSEPKELTPDTNVVNPQETDLYRADPDF
jgi:penicillin-binding protein 1A